MFCIRNQFLKCSSMSSSFTFGNYGNSRTLLPLSQAHRGGDPAFRTTIFRQLSSNSAMPQSIKVTVPEPHVGRVKEAFRLALGRELTLAEQKSLGIPISVVSIRESSRSRGRVNVVKGINRRKTA